jgi:hypothetical protein
MNFDSRPLPAPSVLHFPDSDPILDPRVAGELAPDLTRRHLLASAATSVGSLYAFRDDDRMHCKLDSTPERSTARLPGLFF